MDTFPSRSGPDHIGIVSDRVDDQGLPLVINNWTDGTVTSGDGSADVRAGAVPVPPARRAIVPSAADEAGAPASRRCSCWPALARADDDDARGRAIARSSIASTSSRRRSTGYAAARLPLGARRCRASCSTSPIPRASSCSLGAEREEGAVRARHATTRPTARPRSCSSSQAIARLHRALPVIARRDRPRAARGARRSRRRSRC